MGPPASTIGVLSEYYRSYRRVTIGLSESHYRTIGAIGAIGPLSDHYRRFTIGLSDRGSGEASRAVREARFASHDCRGPVHPQSRYMSRAKHSSASARQRAHSSFRATASAPTSSSRHTAPDERGHTVLVELASASTACLRGGWDDRAERGAVGAAATAAELGAPAVVAERGRVARSSRCARKPALAAPNEPRTQTARVQTA